MLQYINHSYGGCFKTAPNEIDMVLENGEKVVLFSPLEPYETLDAMRMLCDTFRTTIDAECVDE